MHVEIVAQTLSYLFLINWSLVYFDTC